MLCPPLARDKREKKKQQRQERNGGGANGAAANTFSVPRNTALHLDKTAVSVGDLVQLRYFTEYQWLVDFAAYSLLTYCLSEAYIYMLPDKAGQEVNLSLVWLLLVLGFAFKLLLSLTSLYFEGGSDETGGERSLVLVMGGAYLLLAMLVLLVDEATLETGLDEAYRSFNASAASFLEHNAGLDSSGPASKLVTKFCLAVWCGLIGALFTFPGLRTARMHWDSLKFASGDGDNSSSGRSNVAGVLLNVGFVLPLVLTTLWVRPLTRDPLTVRVYRSGQQPLMTDAQFETLRLYLIVLAVVYRLAVMPTYLQSYLNLAHQKVSSLRQEAGKITNLELQRLVIRVFYYLCVVTLQYVAPMIIILYLSLLYKTLGGGSWAGDGVEVAVVNNAAEECSIGDEEEKFAAAAASTAEVNLGEMLPGSGGETVDAIKDQFSLAWSSFKHIFTTQVFKGLLGFSTWWCCFAWFGSSAIGIAYQTYFANQI